VKSILGWTFIKQRSWSRSWNSTGKLVMESILETKAAIIVQFFAGLRGTLAVTFEEGTWSAWLYDLLHSRVDKLVVCNPRKNALLKDGNKSDRIDARKLADLLRGNQLKPVHHGETGVRMLRELPRSYLTIVKDLVTAGVERSGWPRSGKPGCGVAPNDFMSGVWERFASSRRP
jgi:hypothetical protein